jgi:hypothetical protein
LTFSPSLQNRMMCETVKTGDAFAWCVCNEVAPLMWGVHVGEHDPKILRVKICQNDKCISPVVDLVFHIVATWRNTHQI